VCVCVCVYVCMCVCVCVCVCVSVCVCVVCVRVCVYLFVCHQIEGTQIAKWGEHKFRYHYPLNTNHGSRMKGSTTHATLSLSKEQPHLCPLHSASHCSCRSLYAVLKDSFVRRTRFPLLKSRSNCCSIALILESAAAATALDAQLV